MRKINLIISVLIILYSCYGCNNSIKNETKETQINLDSIKISNLIREVYKWYSKNGSQIYFDVIVKDSFQVALDTLKFEKSLSKLKGSNYFSSDFIKNYEKIGKSVDNKLRTGKYYNEINFNFQDYDIWTYSQDNEIDLSENLKVKELVVNGSQATLKWYTDNNDFGYLVKLKKENDTWKVSYLEGLEYKNAVE